MKHTRRIGLIALMMLTQCFHGCGAADESFVYELDGNASSFDAGSSVEQHNAGDASCAGAGRRTCSGSCVNVDFDSQHCGACGAVCAAGEVCSHGVCGVQAPSCSGQMCDGECIDTSRSAQHCGRCGQACNGDQSCVGGECTCPPGTAMLGDGCSRPCTGGYLCNGAGSMQCVDVQNSDAHCGACGVECANGLVCTGGYCLACNPGYVDCRDGSLCVRGACVAMSTVRDAGADAAQDGAQDAGSGSDARTCRPLTEVCDGNDNDCDGFTDEGYPETPCDGEDTDRCLEGTRSCISGVEVCSDLTDSSSEVCDGTTLDEDCDGQINEGCQCVNGGGLCESCADDTSHDCLRKCVDGQWMVQDCGLAYPEDTCVNNDHCI